VVAADVADRDAMAAVFGETALPVRTVVHAAGVATEFRAIEALSAQQLDADLSAKVDGARILDELTAGLELDAFVLFSSGAAAWGSGGQGGYAAANSFLDALAVQRRARGLAATSVAWGAWAEVGLVADGAGEEDRLRRLGVVPMPPDLAVTALERAVGLGDVNVVVADVDWERFAPTFTMSRPSMLLSELVAPDEADSDVDSEFARRLIGLSASQRQRLLVDLVREQAAAVLGHSTAEDIGGDRAFRDLGFDSMTAVELRDRMVRATGLSLPATMVFDYPTAMRLADHLAAHFGGDQTVPTTPLPVSVTDDPIVIVGMACRYPGGVHDPDDLWRLLLDGADAIGEFPADRGWDLGALVGSSATTHGGFIATAADFDAAFFGISPREALTTDPQQRLVLETSWEALEHAGINPTALAGSPVGTFVGAGYSGYNEVLRQAGNGATGSLITGMAGGAISGRVSYALGLEGPAVTVDTACSSSLVAMHLAAQALRAGECELALAGGVTVMADPSFFVGFSELGGLSADGRCKAFSDNADGTGWSEGVGVLVLERQSDAVRNGHTVLAVLRSSAVNQDGASNGLTAPNGPSQQRVIRQALAAAGLSSADVDAVEAHGTGTALGDPIEAQALLATYGQDRDRPLLLGSLKSNIGHTQAAAGVAGVIKMIMAMRHGVLPRTLHADVPSSHVDWSQGSVSLLTESVDWPEADRSRRAGVSAFGVSGTNAHVILEAPELLEVAAVEVSGVVPWVLSAKTPEALRAQAERLLWVDALPADVGLSLLSRGTFEHRAVVWGELRAGLRALVDGVPAPGLVEGVAAGGRVGFVFTGQGAQRLGMGRELYARYSVFAEAFDAVLAELDVPLRDVLWGEDSDLLDQTGWVQPTLFAFEVALFRLMESFGATPDCVVGHSIGEVAAAHVAGILSLADACRLVSARSRLMQALPAGGAMVAVQASEADVLPLLVDGVSIAAVNSADSVVLSGDEAAVEALVAALGVRSRRLRVSHAFHSHRMDPMLAEFRRELAGITFAEPVISMLPTASGDLSTVDYWVGQVRDTVRFADAVARMDVSTVVEIGPDAVLSPLVDGIPVVRRDRDEDVVEALARLWVRGVPVDWKPLYAGARRVTLSAYPFQRRRFWPDSRPANADVSAVGLTPDEHPLVGAMVPLPDSAGVVLTGRVSAHKHPWLAGHEHLPTAVILDLALHAGDLVGRPGLVNLAIDGQLEFPERGESQVQAAVVNGEVTVYARTGTGEWVLQASGTVTESPAAVADGRRTGPSRSRPMDWSRRPGGMTTRSSPR
jgi:acyl transferase domain-containing protein/acyl carrier protein